MPCLLVLACVPIIFFFCIDKDGDVCRGALSVGSSPYRALTSATGKKGRRVDFAGLVGLYAAMYFYGLWVGFTLTIISSVAFATGGFTPHASALVSSLTYEVGDAKATAAETVNGAKKVVAQIGDTCEALARVAQDFYRERAKAFSLTSFNRAARGVTQLFNGERTGSGLLIESNHIVTAGHVIKEAQFSADDEVGKKISVDIPLPYVTGGGAGETRIRSITMLEFYENVGDCSVLLETTKPLNVRGPDLKDIVRVDEDTPGNGESVLILSAMKGSVDEKDDNSKNTFFEPHLSCGTVDAKQSGEYEFCSGGTDLTNTSTKHGWSGGAVLNLAETVDDRSVSAPTLCGVHLGRIHPSKGADNEHDRLLGFLS
eukprot:6463754-Amphidinium_carterae.1